MRERSLWKKERVGIRGDRKFKRYKSTKRRRVMEKREENIKGEKGERR